MGPTSISKKVRLTAVRRPRTGERGRGRALARLLLTKPTWIAQGVNATSSLVLVAVLTRSLSTDAFATYAAVLAAYAFGNALVGTTIGTRAIEALSAGGRESIVFDLRRDAPPIAGCLLAAAATTLIVRVDAVVALSAAAGMLGILLAELGGAHPLGLRRYPTYALLTLAQMVIWVGAAIAAAALLPSPDRLSVCLLAATAGALPYAIYLTAVRGIALARDRRSRRPSASRAPDASSSISAVGLANLALWVLASGDRLVLAHFALAALATYAALYGLLDRVFRTVANAEIQQRLPHAFAARATNEEPPFGFTPRALLLIVGFGAACALVAPRAIAVISGDRYHPDLAMSAVLSMAMAMMLAAVPAYVALVARRRTKVLATIAVGACAVNIGGNLALDASFGTSSAAALTLAGYAIWLGGVILAERRFRRGSWAGAPSPYRAAPSPVAYGD